MKESTLTISSSCLGIVRFYFTENVIFLLHTSLNFLKFTYMMLSL